MKQQSKCCGADVEKIKDIKNSLAMKIGFVYFNQYDTVSRELVLDLLTEVMQAIDELKPCDTERSDDE